jgi:hypothetical protein
VVTLHSGNWRWLGGLRQTPSRSGSTLRPCLDFAFDQAAIPIWCRPEAVSGCTVTSDYSQFTKLDVKDNFAAVIRCGDFMIGTVGRRGSPGRALVDFTDTLQVNFGPDWPNLRLNGKVTQASSREIKENITALRSEKALEILGELSPVEFTYKKSPDGELCLGFIAEDVPDTVGTLDRKAVNTISIVATLVKTVQHPSQLPGDAIERLERLERQ